MKFTMWHLFVLILHLLCHNFIVAQLFFKFMFYFKIIPLQYFYNAIYLWERLFPSLSMLAMAQAFHVSSSFIVNVDSGPSISPVSCTFIVDVDNDPSISPVSCSFIVGSDSGPSISPVSCSFIVDVDNVPSVSHVSSSFIVSFDNGPSISHVSSSFIVDVDNGPSISHDCFLFLHCR